jgi:predicted house-cleaning noncanonical NTP pyrophosphatase (MazG superfamily)
MTKDEALKMAIDKWANNFTHERHQNNAETKFWLAQYKMAFNDLFNTCKEALEQPFTRDWKHTIDERIARDSEFKEALEQPTVAELNDEYLRDTYVEGLNQPAQEPVAWIGNYNHTSSLAFQKEALKDAKEIKPLYTPPHQWQRLTDDEMHEVIIKHVSVDCSCDPYEFARAIQQALKDKNT